MAASDTSSSVSVSNSHAAPSNHLSTGPCTLRAATLTLSGAVRGDHVMATSLGCLMAASTDSTRSPTHTAASSVRCFTHLSRPQRPDATTTSFFLLSASRPSTTQLREGGTGRGSEHARGQRAEAGSACEHVRRAGATRQARRTGRRPWPPQPLCVRGPLRRVPISLTTWSRARRS